MDTSEYANMARIRYQSPPHVPALNLEHTTGRKTIVQGPHGPMFATPGAPSSPDNLGTTGLRRSPRNAESQQVADLDVDVIDSLRGGCFSANATAMPLIETPTMDTMDTSGRPQTQCFFCRQGGYIIACSVCHAFAACFSLHGIRGCIAAEYIPSWRCPPCHKEALSLVPYPIPSRSLGGSRAGMDSRPLIFYNIFLDRSESFSSREASTTFLEALAQSRFIGAEKHLLLLRLKFSDLASRQARDEARKNRITLDTFAQEQQDSRLIITINTHANPENGGLLYGSRKCATLCAVLDYVLGPPKSRPSLLSDSLLFVISCGGLVRHGMQDIRLASSYFTSTFTFGAENVDPLTVTSHFIQTVIDYHIFGCEPLESAILRGFKPEIAAHTSVIVVSHSSTVRLVSATWRRRPNGEDVRCCNQVPKFVETQHRQHGDVILFRCQEKGHSGPRNIRVRPFPEEPGVRKFIHVGKNRIMLEYI